LNPDTKTRDLARHNAFEKGNSETGSMENDIKERLND
tara:strand:- start:122 stop:232 length:111 start_codon:yes stop_codon:yes gene_type:complete